MRYSELALGALALAVITLPASYAAGADGLADLLQGAQEGESPSPNGENSRKLTVPPAEVRRASSEKIRGLFAEDLAKASSPPAKASFAKQLLQHAAETNDPTDRYILIDAARRLAVDAGDVDLAMDCVGSLARSYAVDRQDLDHATLKALAAKPVPGQLDKLADRLMQAATVAASNSDYDSAEEFFQLAANTLRRGNDRDRQKQATERLAAVRAKRKLLTRVAGLEEKLAADPGNAELCDELGRALCFELDEWEKGLAILAKCSDAQLSRLAQMECSPNAVPLALAEGWASLSSTARGQTAGAAAARARMHYATVLRDAKGLDRLAIEKKLKELASKASEGRRGGKSRDPRLILDLDASIISSLSDASKKKPAAGAAVAEWRDRDGLGSSADAMPNSPMPIFVRHAESGDAGLMFKGAERLSLGGTAPPKGAMIIKLMATSVANQRVIYGPGPALRSDGSVWFQANVDGGGEKLERTPTDTYKPNVPIVIGLTWPTPFFITTSSAQSSAATASVDRWTPPAPWTLGGSPGVVFEPFSGIVFRIQVFDTALTPQELSALCRAVAAE